MMRVALFAMHAVSKATRSRWAPLCLVALSIVVSATGLSIQLARVEAAGNQHRILGGVAGSTNFVSQGWHTGSPGRPNVHDPALDLQPYNGAPAGANVYYQSVHKFGGNWGWAGVGNYPSPSGCTGHRLAMWGSNWDWFYLGQVSLLHLNKAAMADFNINPSGYTIAYAGTTKYPDCHADGPHLHEESNLTRNGGFYSGMTFDVWNDTYNWLFLIEY